MGKVLNNQAAELEADKIAMQFVNSHDVVKDMSAAYNADFSNIKFHTDSAADAKVKAADRDAIASGTDIFFGKGILESDDKASRGLLAHELAHTMQQGIVASDGAVSESVTAGAEQGGRLWDWFKRTFSKKDRERLRKEEIQNLIISESDPNQDRIYDEDPNAYFNKMGILSNQLGPRVNVEKRRKFQKPRTAQETRQITEQKRMFARNRKKAMDVSKDMIQKDEMNIGEYNPFELTSIKMSTQGIKTELNQKWKKEGVDDSQKLIDENIQAFRNQIFEPGVHAYSNYLQYMEDHDTDFNSIEQDIDIFTMGDLSYEYGDELSAMTGDMLDLISGNIGTSKGKSYFATLYNNLSDAEMFDPEKGGVDFNTFALQNLVTGEAERMRNVVKTGEYGKEDQKAQVQTQAKVDVVNSISNSLKALPKLAQLTEEQRRKLPSVLQDLCMKYDMVRKQIDDTLSIN